MKNVLLTLLLLAPLTQASETALTEQNIRTAFAALADAARARDVEGVLGHMSDDVHITIEAPAEMGGRLELDRRQYRDLLVQGWSGDIRHYGLEVTINRIDIAADGQTAQVEDLTEESMQVSGTQVKARTLETSSLRLIDGVPKIERIDAVVQP